MAFSSHRIDRAFAHFSRALAGPESARGYGSRRSTGRSFGSQKVRGMQTANEPSGSGCEQDRDDEHARDHQDHGCDREARARRDMEVAGEDGPDPSSGDGAERKADRESDERERDASTTKPSAISSSLLSCQMLKKRELPLSPRVVTHSVGPSATCTMSACPGRSLSAPEKVPVCRTVTATIARLASRRECSFAPRIALLRQALQTWTGEAEPSRGLGDAGRPAEAAPCLLDGAAARGCCVTLPGGRKRSTGARADT